MVSIGIVGLGFMGMTHYRGIKQREVPQRGETSRPPNLSQIPRFLRGAKILIQKQPLKSNRSYFEL